MEEDLIFDVAENFNKINALYAIKYSNIKHLDFIIVNIKLLGKLLSIMKKR